MNTYHKFCPNVFLAKCPEMHNPGEVISVTTRHGKENKCVVFKQVGQKAGYYYYSITRADGFNAQKRAENKAAKYSEWAEKAAEKSTLYYDSAKKSVEFITPGQPILVGHHSEARHRRDLQKSWNAMDKSVEMIQKVESHEDKAAYWESKTNDINLSMPESLEFFQMELEKAMAKHEGLKNGTIEREHSFSLSYAKKEVNEIAKKLEAAKRLWA